jgi:hypothetical protein
MKYPQTPKDWKSGEFIVHRNYTFQSTPDVQILMRLVKEHMSDRGNEGYTKARLEGILFSMFSQLNMRFWERHYHPKTWRVRLLIKKAHRWYHRVFNTKYYRGQVMLYNLSCEVLDEMS